VLSDNDVPENWDWRDVNGVNFVTPSLNQHIPKYCGSCWLHGSTSAFSDRIKIARKAAFPEIQISRQVLLNCQECGSCGGGSHGCVYEYLHKRGLPDASCNQYRAENGECDGMSRCFTCTTFGNCTAVSDYKAYFASEYGSVSGATNMKKEI
jgi:cathepsin X